MSKISEYVPKTISEYEPNTVNVCAKYTIAALAIITFLGCEVKMASKLFGLNQKTNLAVAAILRNSLAVLGYQGISYLERNFKLEPDHTLFLEYANFGLSFFASYYPVLGTRLLGR